MATDWNALAEAATANFNATGQWWLPAAAPTPPPASVDWNALAAQVNAAHDATGGWYVPGDAPTPTDPPPPSNAGIDWNALAAQVNAAFAATGQWYFPSAGQPFLGFGRDAPPLPGFGAFDGLEVVAADRAVFGWAADSGGPNGVTLSSTLTGLLGSDRSGSVLTGPTGPANPEVTAAAFAEQSVGGTSVTLADNDWGGLRSLQSREANPYGVDFLSVRNIPDVALQFLQSSDPQGRTLGERSNLDNLAQGLVDASALTTGFRLSAGFATPGAGFDNHFSYRGTEGGNDTVLLHPGTWAGTQTARDGYTSLVQDGSATSVTLAMGSGLSVIEAAASKVALEISGGPSAAQTGVTPSYTVALADPVAGGVAFGGLVTEALVFGTGLALGATVQVSVQTLHGAVTTLATTELAAPPGGGATQVALRVDPHASFTGVQGLGAATTGSGLAVTAANVLAPSFGNNDPQQGILLKPGSGLWVEASQGPDTLHFSAGTQGVVELRGFDRTQDHLVLEGATADDVRVYDIQGGTLVVFEDLTPGQPLHSLVWLPGVQGLSLGKEVLIG